MIRLLVFSMSLLLFSACHSSKKTASTTPKKPEVLVQFVESPGLMELLERAKKEKKLVFVDIFADWCMPCKLMEQEVFTRKDVADALKQDFLSYHVDGEKKTGPMICMAYQVEAYPTILFLDADGKVLAKNIGSMSATGLTKMAAAAKQKAAAM